MKTHWAKMISRFSSAKNAPLSGLLLIASVFSVRNGEFAPYANSKSRRPHRLRSLLVIAGVLFLAACTRSALGDQAIFVAPTLVGNSSPLILETTTPLPASPTPPCENNLVFLRDINIPDGTHFLAGQPIEKSWEVRNDGSCAWVRGYSVQLADGIAMGAIDRQALPEAQPGEVVVITIQFTAPAAAGTYRSAWKAHDQTGEPFGVQIYIEIIVE